MKDAPKVASPRQNGFQHAFEGCRPIAEEAPDSLDLHPQVLQVAHMGFDAYLVLDDEPFQAEQDPLDGVSHGQETMALLTHGHAAAIPHQGPTLGDIAIDILFGPLPLASLLGPTPAGGVGEEDLEPLTRLWLAKEMPDLPTLSLVDLGADPVGYAAPGPAEVDVHVQRFAPHRAGVVPPFATQAVRDIIGFLAVVAVVVLVPCLPHAAQVFELDRARAVLLGIPAPATGTLLGVGWRQEFLDKSLGFSDHEAAPCVRVVG
jgi:hypothetical protein